MTTTTTHRRIGYGGSTWQVHKFGGTSVATADCFRTVATIVRERMATSNDHDRIAVVVSAMGGKPHKTTDLLLQAVAAAAARDHPDVVEDVLQTVRTKHAVCLQDLFPTDYQRLLDVVTQDLDHIRDILKTVALMKWQAKRIQELVSGYGELWSTQILTQLLDADGFQYLDARKLITIDEDAIQDGAVVWDTCAQNLAGLGLEQTHFVMTGYVASNTQGVATTLQRDGSDYSAAILGRLLSAQSITIWTDVDGVLSADPRRVPLAQVIPEVSFNEACELAYFGAKVIHPKTMQPAVTANIPIYIRNTFHPVHPGSRIFTSSSTQKDKVVCAFSSIEKMALINVEGSGLMGVLGVCKRLFGTLEQAGVNVVLISQASSEHSITFATAQSHVEIAKDVIEEEFRRELDQNRISRLDIKEPCAIIAAVGDSMSSTMGCSGRFFSALGDAKVNVLAIAQGCSERNISAVVESRDSVRALRAVHAAFRLSHTTIRIGIVGMNEVGESLLRLISDQREKLRTTFDLDLQVCIVSPKSEEQKLLCLKNDTDASADSISVEASKNPGDVAKLVDGGLEAIEQYLLRDTCTNHVIFDCTNDEAVGRHHANWLRSRVDVVTANNTGLSGSKIQRGEIRKAEKTHGRQSASYLREVTVGGGLPILKTLRSLVHTGDNIRRIDGILSVSLSYIMYRVSPPPHSSPCCKFDKTFSKGVFDGDLAEGIGTSCGFSEAVREAIDLGLMEEDPTHDLNNEYTCRVLMVLARELGISNDLELRDIMHRSQRLLEGTPVDYKNLTADIDAVVKAKVDAATSRDCVLRHIASVDVQEKTLGINIVEVPNEHLFAITPPSCECVRFFTDRHQTYPLVVQGPSAGADSTASALLAELLYLMRGKSSPQTVALSRSDSGTVLRAY